MTNTNTPATPAASAPASAPVAADACRELLAAYSAIAEASPYVHHRTGEEMLSVWVTDWSVLNQVPLEDGKYKGFNIVWGFYVPPGTVLV